MKSIVAFIIAYLRELYSKSVPFLISLFGAILIVVANNTENSTGKLIALFVGGLFLMHAIDTAATRAEAKAKTAFATDLINMLMDGRDVQISVNHGKSEAPQ